eukprot:CAMPEP_0116554448 /NCGR_PEP_ID=MMETSP0397-20121206/7599_1 /TAXON_ID=216820 /ORGANISM="Cyclophora tenuis, Strain ECT3854" /LENGTH=369 /DNA_ID=CAMNT_0004079613 /DNA_START=1 /DNA_END=1110 /DNA_ORIENTATION=+
MLESVLEPLAFDKYVSGTQIFFDKWWPVMAGIALIVLRVIKYMLYEDDDKTLAGLIWMHRSRPQRNKLMELNEKYVSSNLAVVSNPQFVRRVKKILTYHGYDPQDTLLGTSFCSHPSNRPLENEFVKLYGNHFNLGGLAGFPMGGIAAFKEMASSIPTNGSCLVVYGPHLAVDEKGVVDEFHKNGALTCKCASRAAKNVIRVMLRSQEEAHLRRIESDSAAAAQQIVEKEDAEGEGAIDESQDEEMEAPLAQNVDLRMVDSTLMPHGKRFTEPTDDPTVALAMAMFDAQDELMQNIVMEGCEAIDAGSKIALLGGVQINTPEGLPDYFMPLKFELRDHNGLMVENLLWRDSRKSKRTPQSQRRRRRKVD